MDEEDYKELRREHIKADAADAIAEERAEREWTWEDKERQAYKRRLL